MEKEIKIEAIKDKSEFDNNLTLKRIFVDINGKEKTAYFKASNHFLAVSSLDRINHLMERAVNELIPKFEINNMYFFDIDTQTFFSQLEEKPDWANE
ncbi:MAG: hypothetical protein JJE53_03475 [Candidatus Pacebacteria bacterium]|nr:hypothetical protein [Candidatus Paceibacterota bacterium]